DPARIVTGVEALDAAGPEHISFLIDPRYAAAAAASRAGAFLTGHDAGGLPAPLLRTAKPRQALIRLLTLFHPPAPAAAGIDPTAVVAADARVDPTAAVGPLAVVESGAVLGPACACTRSRSSGRAPRAARTRCSTRAWCPAPAASSAGGSASRARAGSGAVWSSPGRSASRTT